MRSERRRRVLLAVLGCGGVGLLLGPLARAQAPREIEISARRFQFTPNEIPLRAGETVVIALRSLDFPHGFSVPDLGLRVDLVPGRVVRVELRPRAAGTLDFLCDNFCGDAHEEMHGRFLVNG